MLFLTPVYAHLQFWDNSKPSSPANKRRLRGFFFGVSVYFFSGVSEKISSFYFHRNMLVYCPLLRYNQLKTML